jgi:DNA-binding transcriptional regulator YiaG
MIGQEILSIRKKLGLAPSQLAQLLGISSASTAEAREHDEVNVSNAMATILRTLNSLPQREAEDFARSLLKTNARLRNHPPAV